MLTARLTSPERDPTYLRYMQNPLFRDICAKLITPAADHLCHAGKAGAQHTAAVHRC